MTTTSVSVSGFFFRVDSITGNCRFVGFLLFHIETHIFNCYYLYKTQYSVLKILAAASCLLPELKKLIRMGTETPKQIHRRDTTKRFK